MVNFRKNIHIFYDFFIAARHGSLNKAAIKMGISESTASRSIKRLERLLRTQLIIANQQGISLTDDGKKLYRELSIKFK